MTNSGLELPAAFVERLQRIVSPARWDVCRASFYQPKDVAFRVNTLQNSIGDLQRELEETGFQPRVVPWFDAALTLPSWQRAELLETAAHREGRVYVQGLSSMLAVELLQPQPGEQILDLAAAPGGKTLQMAARMNNEGRISAVEPIRGRFFKLRQNLEHGGATCVRTYLTDGRSVGHKTPDRFDRVLLDAPCSGEGRFRADDAATWQYWSARKIREQSRKQKGLLRSALRSVRPGGLVLYATCSFAPEENEAVIDATLRRFPSGIRTVEMELSIDNWQAGLTAWEGKEYDPQVAAARRILPSEQFDGFFLCLLTKDES